jgi:hypothetical protein
MISTPPDGSVRGENLDGGTLVGVSPGGGIVVVVVVTFGSDVAPGCVVLEV